MCKSLRSLGNSKVKGRGEESWVGMGAGRILRRQVQTFCGHGAPAKPPHLPPCSPAPASSQPDIHGPPVRQEAPHVCPIS